MRTKHEARGVVLMVRTDASVTRRPVYSTLATCEMRNHTLIEGGQLTIDKFSDLLARQNVEGQFYKSKDFYGYLVKMRSVQFPDSASPRFWNIEHEF